MRKDQASAPYEPVRIIRGMTDGYPCRSLAEILNTGVSDMDSGMTRAEQLQEDGHGKSPEAEITEKLDELDLCRSRINVALECVIRAGYAELADVTADLASAQHGCDLAIEKVRRS